MSKSPTNLTKVALFLLANPNGGSVALINTTCAIRNNRNYPNLLKARCGINTIRERLIDERGNECITYRLGSRSEAYKAIVHIENMSINRGSEMPSSDILLIQAEAFTDNLTAANLPPTGEKINREVVA